MTHIKPSDIEYKLASTRQRLEQIFGWPVPGQALPLHLSRETVQSLQGEQSLLDMEDRLVVELHTQIDGVDRATFVQYRFHRHQNATMTSDQAMKDAAESSNRP